MRGNTQHVECLHTLSMFFNTENVSCHIIVMFYTKFLSVYISIQCFFLIGILRRNFYSYLTVLLSVYLAIENYSNLQNMFELFI